MQQNCDQRISRSIFCISKKFHKNLFVLSFRFSIVIWYLSLEWYIKSQMLIIRGILLTEEWLQIRLQVTSCSCSLYKCPLQWMIQLFCSYLRLQEQALCVIVTPCFVASMFAHCLDETLFPARSLLGWKYTFRLSVLFNFGAEPLLPGPDPVWLVAGPHTLHFFTKCHNMTRFIPIAGNIL